jgi:stage IV sporulation protein B
MFSGQSVLLDLPEELKTKSSHPEITAVDGKFLESRKTGISSVTLSLFGKIPYKTMDVAVLPEIKVIPGGQSIGVKLNSKGVLVVGFHAVQTAEGNRSPAEKAEIHIGDYIVKINGQAVQNVKDVGEAVTEAGKQKKKLNVTLLREGKEHTVVLTPLYDVKDKSYRIGVYVRDSAAGVGTLTFYDPQKHVYGALGHVISDVDTGQPIQISNGKIVHSTVTSIQKGESGEPGEKRAIFFREDQVLGNINKNTPFGIFGEMPSLPGHGMINQPIPIALADQVKEGPAQILTVVEGQKVERFNIEISHRMKQNHPATKGLIIKVTDPRLLEKTGGIVQGMSGSPIIQDGKLVGAVTHVFVNDPSSGYGTYIEWMLQDAGVIPKQTDPTNRVCLFFKGKVGSCILKRRNNPPICRKESSRGFERLPRRLPYEYNSRCLSR